MVGLGIFFTNKSRVTSFEKAYNENSQAFVESELARADKTIAEFRNIVFKVIPMIIVVAALLLVFVDKPIWRAIGISTIAMMIAIMFVDSNADARIKVYKKQLESAEGIRPAE